MITASAKLLIALVGSIAVIGVGRAESDPYQTIKFASQFAIGGVGYAGVRTHEELAMRELRDYPRGEEQLRNLLRDATPAGQMYALFALRQLNVRDYANLSEPYRHSSAVITRQNGCIVHEEAVPDTIE